MPRFKSIGLAPAARLRRPSVTIAWAMTVDVVVPSPATSLVLVAACFSIWAPMFWKWFSSSISLATVTPSWVTVGGPHFLSMATLRPLGPSVTLTAWARASIPFLSCRRADSSKTRSFAVISFRSSCCWFQASHFRVRPTIRIPELETQDLHLVRTAPNHREDVALGQDQQGIVFVLEFGSAVLREQDGVADLQVH